MDLGVGGRSIRIKEEAEPSSQACVKRRHEFGLLAPWGPFFHFRRDLRFLLLSLA